MPTIRIDATSIAAATRKSSLTRLEYLSQRTLHCASPADLALRDRIDRVQRFTNAGARSEVSDPLFRRLCYRLHGDLAGLPDAWEARTHYRWDNGQLVGMKRAEELWPLRPVLSGDNPLSRHKPFVDAEGMMKRILAEADCVAAQRERAWREERYGRGRERAR